MKRIPISEQIEAYAQRPTFRDPDFKEDPYPIEEIIFGPPGELRPVKKGELVINGKFVRVSR